MRTALIVTLFAAGGLAAQERVGTRTDDGLKSIQGEWKIVKMEWGGPKTDKLNAPIVVLDDDNYTIRDGETVVEKGTVQLAAQKTPNRIDVKTTSGPHKGKEWHGVYELEGDTLRAVVAPNDTERPTKLVEPKPGQRAFTLKRVNGKSASKE
jgi:uncharacterized protein (TIGR03067 family)